MKSGYTIKMGLPPASRVNLTAISARFDILICRQVDISAKMKKEINLRRDITQNIGKINFISVK